MTKFCNSIVTIIWITLSVIGCFHHTSNAFSLHPQQQKQQQHGNNNSLLSSLLDFKPQQSSFHTKKQFLQKLNAIDSSNDNINDNNDDNDNNNDNIKNDIVESNEKIPYSSLTTASVSASAKSSTSTASPPSSLSFRSIQRMEKNSRLPVWPVGFGVIIFIISKIFGNEIGAKIEHAIGGRVCPNFYNYQETSPFVMLVHHRHAFHLFDPIRYFQRAFILPEGFPAHPHRGFVTVTYFLKGGFQHRDSLGVQQQYGAIKNNNNNNNIGNFKHHTQWLHTGAGILHEEMFLNPSNAISTDQELYQLWLNVPAREKMVQPYSMLLGPNEAPHIKDNNKCETIVLAGTFNGQSSTAPIVSDVSIFHVQCQPGGKWKYKTLQETIVIYVRRGSVMIQGETIPTHYTAYMSTIGSVLELTPSNNNDDGFDCLILAGSPLVGEPIAAAGSMVMNTQREIDQAYQDYQLGKMGTPWDHTLSDEQWQDHIRRNPSIYKYEN